MRSMLPLVCKLQHAVSAEVEDTQPDRVYFYLRDSSSCTGDVLEWVTIVLASYLEYSGGNQAAQT